MSCGEISEPIEVEEQQQTDTSALTEPATTTETSDTATSQQQSVHSNARPARPMLNLSLPENKDQGSDTALDFEKPQALPDLFANQKGKEKKKLAVGAKVLTDPSKGMSYTESIKGAEVKVEIQTNQH
ncbi:MAG: hypothetical protein ACJAYE_002980 [Candidatus Azotimanducaceae bacterium]|jgi:hypothetical protein